MNEEKQDNFWSKAGDALESRRAQSFWISQRARIMARLEAKRPLRVRHWVAVSALAAIAISLFLYKYQPSRKSVPENIAQLPAESSDARVESLWDARITAVEGQVTVFLKNDEAGIPAAVDMPLEAGDRVQTGADGRMELVLSAEGIIELSSKSNAVIGDLSEDDTWFDLTIGTLIAKLRWEHSTGRRLRVKTPTCVAAVRGTEFGVNVSDEGETTVGVFDEGKVAVRAVNAPLVEETVIEARQEVRVPRGTRALKTQERDGRMFLSIGELKHFRAHWGDIRRLNNRQAELRRTWKRMPPAKRQELRRDIKRRHREHLKSLPPEKRQKVKERGRVRKARSRGKKPGYNKQKPQQRTERQMIPSKQRGKGHDRNYPKGRGKGRRKQ